MPISIIVAMAQNGVIGRDNTLPWHIPEDLRYFKRRTLGKCLIMGRKTYDSIGRPLPGRTNVVVTRQKAWRAEGVYSAGSLDEALALANSVAANAGGETATPTDKTRAIAQEIMVIGGAQLYREALPRADRLYITQIHGRYDGDAFFPVLDLNEWQETEREDFQSDKPGIEGGSFLVLDRVTA